MAGLVICALGLLFGLITYLQLRDLPVHNSMREVSELIWETCKTYLFTQGKFLLILEIFIGVDYPVLLRLLRAFRAVKVIIILLFSMHRDRGQLRASRGTASASTRSPTRARLSPACAAIRIPVTRFRCSAGMSIGMVLISVELLIMLCILLFIPARLRRALLHRLRHRRIARARRRCASPAASSPRSPISARI